VVEAVARLLGGLADLRLGARTIVAESYTGLGDTGGITAALFASQSCVRRQRTERRTGMRLRSLGDADIGVLSGRSSWRGLLNHFRRQVLKIAI
jgi:hypothetical protein